MLELIKIQLNYCDEYENLNTLYKAGVQFYRSLYSLEIYSTIVLPTFNTEINKCQY